MDHIGIDLHKNQSQICILTEYIEKRIGTSLFQMPRSTFLEPSFGVERSL
jgi:hypothetical protein